LWRNHIATPTMVGQAEPVLANVSSHRDGVLAQLRVNRFQRVKSGDLVGLVLITDPRVLSSTIEMIKAEIEMIRSDVRPVLQQQSASMRYDQLRLDWMRQRADLASAKVTLQLAETDLGRNEELAREKIISQKVLDEARANRDKRRGEVEELTRLVNEAEIGIKNLLSVSTNQTASDRVEKAIAFQESKLALTEVELSPIELKAPIDGIVNAVFFRAGEAVMAGKPVVTIATQEPVRIVGYLRAPISSEPRVGMSVQVRTRGVKREVGLAKILEVGTQLEPLPAAVASPIKLVTSELGLPIDISIPSDIRILPGELVDLVLIPQRN